MKRESCVHVCLEGRYEVSKNMKSTYEKCDLLILREKSTSFFGRKIDEHVKNMVKWKLERICI